jgi:hypothetical protein
MTKKLLLTVGVLTVYCLHQDFWNWKEYEPLVFGCLPVGLAYHAAYSIAAAVTMAILVKFAWPRELHEIEAQSDRTPPRS